MQHHRLGRRSKQVLSKCHVDLIALARIALLKSPYDIGFHSGRRTVDEQKKLFETGKSKVLTRSRHIGRPPEDYEVDELVSHAYDYHIILPDGTVTWDNNYYQQLGHDLWRPLAKELDLDIRLGCFWKNFPDGPHVELREKQ
jgi:hypothetical protein